MGRTTTNRSRHPARVRRGEAARRRRICDHGSLLSVHRRSREVDRLRVCASGRPAIVADVTVSHQS